MKKIVSIFLVTIYGMCMVACGSRSSSTEVKDNVLTEEEKADRNKSENGIVSQAEHYIHTNYAQPISLALVAEKIDVSPNYLSSLFHKELGESYSKYVTRVRMEHAKRIMKENPGLRIYEIVNQVGYVSVKHFSYVFKQLFGVTPGEYQQSLKAD